MSTKNEKIKKIYKNYLCKNGHTLRWTGKELVYSDKKCEKCNNEIDKNSSIRWECSKCNLYYCSSCFNNLLNEYCPGGNHKLTSYANNSSLSINGYTCDRCLQSKQAKDGMWYDLDCNYTICPECYKLGQEIPNIFED